MYLNFTEISKVPFRAVLNYLNIPYEPTQQGELKGQGFIVNIDKNLYFNPLGEDRGSVINFLANHKKIDLRTAAGEIKKLFIDQEKPKEEKETKLPDYPFTYHKFLEDQGITELEAQKYGFTYCKQGILRGKIAIQVNDPCKKKQGYIGKHIDKDGYFCPPQLKAGEYLWNFDRIDIAKIIILTSDPFRAMKHIKDGNTNTVSLLTPNLTEAHITLLSAISGVIVDHPKPDNIISRLSARIFVKQI